MKSLISVIFLTAVVFFLDSGANKAWAEYTCGKDGKDGTCPEGKICLPANDVLRGEKKDTYITKYSCQDDPNYVSKKDLLKECKDTQKSWDEEYEKADEKYEKRQKELKEKVEDLQKKFQDAQEEGQKALDSIQDAYNEAEENYANLRKESEQNSAKDKKSLQDQVRQTEMETHELNTQKSLAQTALAIAQNNLIIAKTEPLEMLQLECMEKVRSTKKKGSVINGGANAAMGGSDFMSRLYAACMQSKMRERKAEYDKLNSEVEARKATLSTIIKKSQQSEERYKELKLELSQFDYKAAQAAAEAEANHKKKLENLNQKFMKQQQLMSQKQQLLNTQSQQAISDMKGLQKNLKRLNSIGIEMRDIGRTKSDTKSSGTEKTNGTCCTDYDEEEYTPEDIKEKQDNGEPRQCPTIEGQKKNTSNGFDSFKQFMNIFQDDGAQ